MYPGMGVSSPCTTFASTAHTRPANTQVPRQSLVLAHTVPEPMGFCGAHPRLGDTSSLSICCSVAGWGSLLWWEHPGRLFWALLECSLQSRTPKLKADR